MQYLIEFLEFHEIVLIKIDLSWAIGVSAIEAYMVH